MFASILAKLELVLVLLTHAAWQSALLGALVLLLTWSLGRRLDARWRFALWLLVFFRLAMPVLPAAPWSVFQFFVPSSAEGPVASMPTAAVAQDGRYAQPGDRRVHQAVANGPRHSSPVPVPSADHAPLAAHRRWPDVVGLLVLAWLTGIALLSLRCLANAARLMRRRRGWVEATDASTDALLQRCRKELNVRGRVRLFLAPDAVGPATCGILQPCIVLPERLFRSLLPAELRLVLLHELIHIRRRDVLLDHVVTFVTIVHWFHPVAWIARYFLRHQRELACDAVLLDRATPSEAADYGCVMLKTIESLSIPLPLSGLVGMFVRGTPSFLHTRIRTIAAYRSPTFGSRVAGGVVFTVLALVGLTGAQTRAPSDKTSGNPAAAGAGNFAPADKERKEDESATETQTVAGICVDETQQALKGIALSLYRFAWSADSEAERLQATESDAAGRFRFEPLPAILADEAETRWAYVVVATSTGRASQLHYIQEPGAESGELKLTMAPAATLQGRVADRNGQPIAGAMVFTQSIGNEPLTGVCSAMTDADGRYSIDDLAPFDVDKAKPVEQGDGSYAVVGECFFTVRHPNYGEQRPGYKRVPATIDVQLSPAAILEGQVVDMVTGEPAEGVTVFVQGVEGEATHGYQRTRTDEAGNYRLGSLLEGKYNVMVHHPERACAALDSLAVTAGQLSRAPDLKLIEGGWIEGQLVDAETEQPVTRDPASDRMLEIGLYGPARPKSGAACQSARVDESGRFRLRVSPGVNFPYVMYPEVWERTQRREFYERGIEVGAGEVVSLAFRIAPTKPPKNPEPSLVRLPTPVAGEREAAETIRDLGGWYKVDDDLHVIEVNMVYHLTAEGARHDNPRLDTDMALRRVGAFPRLKRLFLTRGQATDDALAVVETLKDLEVLMIWDAEHVSDAGTRHLTGLNSLQNIHINNGQLGNKSLAVFSGLPKLTRLSLQGNGFTDDGLKHLAAMKHLKSLWLGMGKTPFTDAAAEPLAELTDLEELDLQSSRLSDAGIAKLAALTNLKLLYVDGSGADGSSITDASVAAVGKLIGLESLGIQNTKISASGVRRLCEMPKLKRLMLSSSRLSDEFREELKQEHPDLKLYVSRSENESE